MKTRTASVLAVATLCFAILLVLLGSGNVRTEGFEYQPPSADKVISLGFENYFQYVKNEASKVAEEVFGNVKKKREEFQEELVGIHDEVKDCDFVLVFNSGGWGNTPLNETGDEWDTVVGGIESWFKDTGHTYALIEHNRCENSVRDILRELKGFLTARYAEAEELAAKVHFITEVQPDTRVVLLGESSGAMYSTDVMKLLESNPRVFSIQAGQPFWDKDSLMPRTLLLNDNGMTPDSLTTGDLWAMFKHNFLHLAGIFRPGNFVKLDDTIIAPGHKYSWEFPAIRQQVNEFLESNFGPQAL